MEWHLNCSNTVIYNNVNDIAKYFFNFLISFFSLILNVASTINIYYKVLHFAWFDNINIQEKMKIAHIYYSEPYPENIIKGKNFPII